MKHKVWALSLIVWFSVNSNYYISQIITNFWERITVSLFMTFFFTLDLYCICAAESNEKDKVINELQEDKTFLERESNCFKYNLEKVDIAYKNETDKNSYLEKQVETLNKQLEEYKEKYTNELAKNLYFTKQIEKEI